MSAVEDRTTPAEIRKKGGQRITIRWTDGHESPFPARYLRGRCPCARCVDEDTGRRVVGEAEVAADVGLAKLQLVGNYAVQIHFSDGHGTGLYAFDHLRRLCPCAECGGS